MTRFYRARRIAKVFICTNDQGNANALTATAVNPVEQTLCPQICYLWLYESPLQPLLNT